MIKIAIVTELNMNNVNYGNRLQAFALNRYINKNFSNCTAETILLKRNGFRKYTKIYYYQIINKMKKILKIFMHVHEVSCPGIKERRERLNNFTRQNIALSSEFISLKQVSESDYDIYIVGSDVVWAQTPGRVSRVKFLDIRTKKNILRLSYAASFGTEIIPNENIRIIKKYLNAFDGISVREKTSVKLLNDIGVQNVIHVCDSTLLLTKCEWEKYEETVNVDSKFVFVYLLGKNREQREKIKKIANKNDLKIVCIPHANGEYEEVDEDFADYNIETCSIGQWLWLVHNSEYVFTDSFHGVAFSTIFQKKFIVVTRELKYDINIRMIDYLDTIDESNKFFNVNDLDKLDLKDIEWDYDKITNKMLKYINDSKDYLNKMIK